MEDDTYADENGDPCEVFILITRGRLQELETELEESRLRIRYLEHQLKQALAHAPG